MSYRVAVAGLRVELTEDEAEALWDEWPEQQRTGAHGGTFILWDLDHLGRRCFPVVCRRVSKST
jgi:hypothetical protein